MSQEFDEVAAEFKQFDEKMRDPLVIGALLHKIAEERRSTNLLFHNLLEKIESLEAKLSSFESKLRATTETAPTPSPSFTSLSETDEKILQFVVKRGKACASDLQKSFGYKGRNAASSRLNSLFKTGLLEKNYAGKTVFFKVKNKS